MKTLRIAAMVLLSAGSLCAQQIGDVARAERKRQQELPSSRVIQKIGDKKDAPAQEAVKTAEPATPAPATDLRQIEKEMAEQRTEVMKQRSALLVKLNEVIHDKKAVAEIEAQLVELQNRSAQLKLDRLAKLEEKTK